MTRFLYQVLAVVSFGFYVHPMAAFENPGHPRDAEEIQRESDDKAQEHTKDILDIIDPDNAPHTTDDAKNFAGVEK